MWETEFYITTKDALAKQGISLRYRIEYNQPIYCMGDITGEKCRCPCHPIWEGRIFEQSPSTFIYQDTQIIAIIQLLNILPDGRYEILLVTEKSRHDILKVDNKYINNPI